jgi:hypothetical protein
LEEALAQGAPPEELRTLDAELGQRTREVLALIDRLRTRSVP